MCSRGKDATVRISRRTFAKSSVVAGAMAALPKTHAGEVSTAGLSPSLSNSTPASAAAAHPSAPQCLTVLESMTLAGKHLLMALNPNKNYLPYFNMEIEKDYKASYHFSWPAHDIGRWLDALLRLENATGFSIPPQLQGAMLENLQQFFDNPDNLLIPPAQYAQFSNPLNQIEFGSMRESILALNALARFQGNRWALEQGHRMMETVWKISHDNGTWDFNKLEAMQRLRPMPRNDPMQTHGRSIEALVWFYEISRDPLALRLANRFARYHLQNTTFPDGTFNPASTGDHAHSYMGTLRGLLLFGELTNQREYIERVAVTYRTTVLGRFIRKSGLIGHGLYDPSLAEPASTGDVVQLGLWLARNGYTEFLDDAERLVRACLLPSQIVQRPELKPDVDDGADQHTNLSARAVGAYGGMHPRFWGKNPTTDITCAVLHSLVDVYQHIAVSAPAGLTVNFHFDYEDHRVRLRSERQENARVSIEVKNRENVWIRIPAWAPKGSVHLTVNGKPCDEIRVGMFACIPRDLLPGTIELRYGLPVHKEVERIGNVDYALKWKGDDVIGIAPNSDFFPFYPTLVE